MRETMGLRVSTLALLAILAFSGPVGAEIRYHRPVAFHSGDGLEQPGLFLFRMGSAIQADRVLVVAPRGQRIVSTQVLSGPEGRQTLRLMDDGSGYWIELEQRWNLSAPTVEGLLDRAMEAFDDPDHLLRQTLTTQGGIRLSCTIPADEVQARTAMVECLEEEHLGPALLAELPKGLRNALPFLAEALGVTGGVTSAHARIPRLLRALPTADPADDGRREGRKWRQEVGAVVKGLEVRQPPWPELLPEYQTLSPAAPFSDVPMREE